MSELGRKRLVPGLATRRASVCYDERTYNTVKKIAKQESRLRKKKTSISDIVREATDKLIAERKGTVEKSQ